MSGMDAREYGDMIWEKRYNQMKAQGRLFDGVVARVSDKGMQLEGEDQFRLFSRYADPAITPPRVGMRVDGETDARGFVRRLYMSNAVSAEAPHSNGAAHAADAPPAEHSDDGAEPPEQPNAAEQLAQDAVQPDRETLIGRYAVLNTATAILSSGGRAADADAVIGLAERLERWAHRPMA